MKDKKSKAKRVLANHSAFAVKMRFLPAVEMTFRKNSKSSLGVTRFCGKKPAC